MRALPDLIRPIRLLRLCWCNWEYLSHLVSSTSFIPNIYPISGNGNKGRKKKRIGRQRRSGDESPNNIYLRKNPSGLHLIDLISATSGRLFKGKGWGRESITERVETTLAPTMSTMMVSLLLVLPPVNAGTRYFPNLRV